MEKKMRVRQSLASRRKTKADTRTTTNLYPPRLQTKHCKIRTFQLGTNYPLGEKGRAGRQSANYLSKGKSEEKEEQTKQKKEQQMRLEEKRKEGNGRLV